MGWAQLIVLKRAEGATDWLVLLTGRSTFFGILGGSLAADEDVKLVRTEVAFELQDPVEADAAAAVAAATATEATVGLFVGLLRL